MANYKHIALKISGEAFSGEAQPFDPKKLSFIANNIKFVLDEGYEVCLIIGGGNIFRGAYGESIGIDRATSDHMGMLATVMNALALQKVLEKKCINAKVMSSIPMQAICEPYVQRKAKQLLQEDRIVICAAGTSNPYFTTDTAAALRAAELDCNVLMKGTKVDGVYASDPLENPEADYFATLSYKDVLLKNLQVMDLMAISLAQDNNIPILVFSINKSNSILHCLKGECKYTFIGSQ